MKVLMVNGSPRANGNTAQVLNFMKGIFEAEGIETVQITVPNNLDGCNGCAACKQTNKCSIENDMINESIEIWKTCDAILVGTPVYFSGMSGSLKNFLDRFFYASASVDRHGRVAGAIACVRRAGGTAALDMINHYLTYGGMTLAGTSYWPMVYGATPGESLKDIEGMQAAEELAVNMIYAMKAYALAKDKYGLPQNKPKKRMNFIR